MSRGRAGHIIGRYTLGVLRGLVVLSPDEN